MSNLINVKKIAYKRIKKYSFYWFPLLILQILLLVVAFIFDKEIGKYLGILFTIITSLVFLTFLFIFDVGLSRKLKKNNFKIDGHNYEKEKLINFYNSVKLVTLMRTLINIISFIIILSFSLIFFI